MSGYHKTLKSLFLHEEMVKKLIQEGAEAKIYLDGDVVLKQRVPKSYRHPGLDLQIRTRRTRHEAKLLCKAKGVGVRVPEVFNVNKKFEPTSKYDLEIEYIEGDKLSETLNGYPEAKQVDVMKKLGEQVALMHSNDIIHSDLTTSNTILKGDEVLLIDFGLGYFSVKIEDKAVDLHLIKQALEAKHFQNDEKLFEGFLKGYKFEDSSKVIERLGVVEKRGRYKH